MQFKIFNLVLHAKKNLELHLVMSFSLVFLCILCTWCFKLVILDKYLILVLHILQVACVCIEHKTN